LREDLDQLRQKLAPSNGTSLRELLARLRELASGQNTMHKVEQHLIQAELTRLAREFKKKKKKKKKNKKKSRGGGTHLVILHECREYRKLSNLANHRIEYYRALQQISDHVGVSLTFKGLYWNLMVVVFLGGVRYGSVNILMLRSKN
jgi:hypothetical protein